MIPLLSPQVWLAVSSWDLPVPSDQKGYQTQLLSILLYAVPHWRYSSIQTFNCITSYCDTLQHWITEQRLVKSSQFTLLLDNNSCSIVVFFWSRQQVEPVAWSGSFPPTTHPAAGGIMGLLLWPSFLLFPPHGHLCLIQQSLHFTGT